MKSNHFAILIIIVPLIASYFVPVIGWWKKRLCFPLSILAIAGSFTSSVFIMKDVMQNGTIHYHLGGWIPPWGIEYVIDHLNAFMAVLVSFISLVVAIYSKKSVEKELPGKIPYFYAIYLLLMTGLLGIIVTGDMFNLYVFLEIASLTAYALIAIGEDGATLASFNYIIMGTIGACFYLLGVGYIYIMTGSLNMADISRLLPDMIHSKVILVAFAFFVVGTGIKMGLFPLHVWLPDAYTYAPSAVSAFIAPLMTKVGVYVLIRIMISVYPLNFSFKAIPANAILGWIAAIAIIAGSILAICQSDLKRMLAYSSVSQIGYILLGVTLANRMGMIGSLLHIMNHAFMKGALFLTAGGIIYRIGTRNINNFHGLNRVMPWSMGAFVIAALSMIGIPPTAGFFSKWYLILGAIDAKKWIFVGVILLSSLLNAVYFFNVIEKIYFGHRKIHADSSIKEIKQEELPASMIIPLLILSAGILLLGILSDNIIRGILVFAIPKSF